MLRDIFTNKWILGMIAFLIIIVGGCLLWYQRTTSPYEREAAKTADYARQIEKNRQSKKESSTDTEAAALHSLADSETQSADKQRTDVNPVTDKTVLTHTQNDTESPVETAETADLNVSPFGFGPYPELPDDYPSKVDWTSRNSAQAELLTRVLVKLWTEGEKNFRGGGTHNGKVYPWYHNTIYVKIVEIENADGEIVARSVTKMSGPSVDWSRVDDWLNPPSHIRILDLDSSGIYPYEYLNLP